jgi:uncharacterized protein (TIGR03435 family)
MADHIPAELRGRIGSGREPTAVQRSKHDFDFHGYPEQRLGLKLESTKSSVDVLVIDHAEEPTETLAGQNDPCGVQ